MVDCALAFPLSADVIVGCLTALDVEGVGLALDGAPELFLAVPVWALFASSAALREDWSLSPAAAVDAFTGGAGLLTEVPFVGCLGASVELRAAVGRDVDVDGVAFIAAVLGGVTDVDALEVVGCAFPFSFSVDAIAGFLVALGVEVVRAGCTGGLVELRVAVG